VIKGLGEAKKLVKILHPDVIFSKGGFVSVPVVLAGKSRHVPTIIHESDMTPGLANKISMPSASKICCNFPETIEHLPAGKAVLTGSPIRQELLSGDKYKALEFLHFTQDKPVIMVVGGSLGSVAVNDAVRSVLPELLQSFQIVHLCGKGKIDESLKEVVDRLMKENIELKKTNEALILKGVLLESSEGLTEIQKDKFMKLAEALEKSDKEKFISDLDLLKKTISEEVITPSQNENKQPEVIVESYKSRVPHLIKK
jgi:hypothetical protein